MALVEEIANQQQLNRKKSQKCKLMVNIPQNVGSNEHCIIP
jgi:hypothetical protein